MLFDYELRPKLNRSATPTALQFSTAVTSNLSRNYQQLPTNQIEFGGLLCGKMDAHNRAVIHKAPWIPSSIASEDTFYFNEHIIKKSRLYCGDQQILGMWHTHSADAPLPSSVDRNTTRNLNIVGCVVADKMRCFKGEKNIPIVTSTERPSNGTLGRY